MATTAKRKKKSSKSVNYLWKEGKRFPVAASVAAEELKSIKRRDGILKPQNVVDHARDPGSPLHKCFEWEDTVAANRFRLHQARCLMHSIYTVKYEEGKAEPDAPFVFNVQTEEEGRTYRTAAEIMDDEPATDYLFDVARQTIKGWRKRYAHIQKLANIHAEIDKLE